MTKQMRAFAVHYAETRNATVACRLAGYSEKYAISKSHLLLKNKEVMEIVTNLENKYFKDQFQKLALDAVKTLSDVLADDQNRAIQLQSVKYILHEAGITDQPDSDSGTIEIKVTLPKELE